MLAMGQGFEKTYEPESDKVEYYAKRYKMYLELGSKIEIN
jgi:L-ribulokinase